MSQANVIFSDQLRILVGRSFTYMIKNEGPRI